LSNSGSVAFTSQLRNTQSGFDKNGLYYHDGTLQKIVREADTFADTGEFFIDLGDFTIDDAGRVAFLAKLSSEGPDEINGDWGLFSYQDGEIEELVREGDTINGRQIRSINESRGNLRGEVLLRVTAPNGIDSLLLVSPDTDPSADFDADGDVDGDDLARWEDNYGTTCANTHWQGDTDDDRDTDGSDFLNWQRNFSGGNTGSGFDTVNPVPEPGSLGLAIFVFGSQFFRRRCRVNRN